MGLFRRATDRAEIERMKAEVNVLREALERHGTTTFELVGRVNGLANQPAPVDPRLDELAEELANLDARVTAVSTELANQLTELGKDIDALNDGPPPGGPDGAVLGEIRDGQTRLANEQARYQIAFREDLARLAEQLRHAR